jgi:hypothetical protein
MLVSIDLAGAWSDKFWEASPVNFKWTTCLEMGGFAGEFQMDDMFGDCRIAWYSVV